jgi:polar amino acid transport system ATP-binding protein
MDFAHDVSDRVFYIDEGVIYEEGTPEAIFDNPQREKTRAFIYKLKIFNYEINSVGFDMVTMNAQVEIFCRKYNIAPRKIYNVQLVLEELIMEIFKHCYAGSKPDMGFAIAYAEDEISISLTYIADEFNPFAHATDDMDGLGMVLVKNFSKQQDHSFVNGQNRINIKL